MLLLLLLVVVAVVVVVGVGETEPYKAKPIAASLGHRQSRQEHGQLLP